MLLIEWLNNCFNYRSMRRIRPATPARGRRFQPCVELLEERVVPSTITVQNNADSGAGSLRAALLSANSGDTINFATGGLTGGQTITLTSGSLSPDVNVTITGSGAPPVTIIDAGNRAFDFTNSNVTSATLQDLTIQGAASDANNGGAILSAVGGNFELTIEQCTISNSSTNAAGGGIANKSGTLNLIGDTISGNTSTGSGGGLYIAGGTADASNCTIAGNIASAAAGGGIAVAGGIFYVNNVTVSDNTGAGGGGMYVSGSNTTVDLSNMILADDFDGSSHNYDLTQDGNATINAYTSLIQNSPSGTINGNNYFNITGENAMLGSLANNGGSTQTMALLAGSPAIDAGETIGAPLTDQRGYARPQGNGIDIGAYELRETVTIISGNNQSVETNVRYPNVLEVQVTSPDLNGTVMANASVTFSVVSYNGAGVTFLTNTTQITDSNGDASVKVKANTISGTYTVVAALGASSAQFSLFNTSEYSSAAYINAYDGYVYAYSAYVTTGDGFSYEAMNYAYSAFYYAYYAYYFNSIQSQSASETCAYYAYSYGYTSAYYSSFEYNYVSGNIYSQYAAGYDDTAYNDAFEAALGS
jgi:hypothetical protein